MMAQRQDATPASRLLDIVQKIVQHVQRCVKVLARQSQPSKRTLLGQPNIHEQRETIGQQPGRLTRRNLVTGLERIARRKPTIVERNAQPRPPSAGESPARPRPLERRITVAPTGPTARPLAGNASDQSTGARTYEASGEASRRFGDTPMNNRTGNITRSYA